MDDITRRRFMLGGAGMAGATLLGGCGSTGTPTRAAAAAPTSLPHPDEAPFDTVVVLMMENRSFDHFLGWMPGANGRQEGLSYPDVDGVMHDTWMIAPDWQGCGHSGPSHDWQSMVKHLDGGKVDGFLRTEPKDDLFAVGYYREQDLPVLSRLATNYTTFDRYFCSFLGATWPNRFYQHSAATDVDNTLLFPQDPGVAAQRPSNLQLAIWDRLEEAGLTGGYYYHTEPMTQLYKSKKYDAISHPYGQFLTDAAAGTLPNVAFVDPDYGTIAEFTGTSNDFHPHGNIEVGDAFVGDVYEALKNSPQWDRMVVVINFDENGGFFDHVVPPKVADDNVNPNPGPHPDYSQLGFRVPAIALGPYAAKRLEQRGPYEHCSVLRMIEWRWGLEPMSERDRSARNLAEALDFSRKRSPVELPADRAHPAATPCEHPRL